MFLVRYVNPVVLIGIYVMSLTNGLARAIGPDDENSTYLDSFLEILDKYSGLSSVEPKNRYNLTTGCADYNPCVVNANGTIVWNIRSMLYDLHMTETIDDKVQNVTTLNGCLTLTTNDDYNTCMETVRQSMISFLELQFSNLFNSELISDCEILGSDNCIALDQEAAQ